MSYIIMSRDECGDEFRACDTNFSTMQAACDRLPQIREEYPECTHWAELLRDKAYYMDQRQRRTEADGDWWDDYDH